MDLDINLDKFLKMILENKERLVFGPNDFSDEMGIHFNTAKNFIENLSAIANIVYTLRNHGIELDIGKTPKGVPRMMINPTEEKIGEIEEFEIELGFDEDIVKDIGKRSPTKDLRQNIFMIQDRPHWTSDITERLPTKILGHERFKVRMPPSPYKDKFNAVESYIW